MENKPHVSEATRARTQAFLDKMPKKPREELRAIFLRTTHLLMCCPVEVLEDGNHHRWRRDKQPPIGSAKCMCKGIPMRWNGCDV